MEFSFPWPMSRGEWLAWTSAAVTLFFGLVLFFAPRLSLRVLRLQTKENHPEAVSEARATMAGFYLGLGLCCLFLAQPLLYLALGASWTFTAFGRLVSILADRGGSVFNWVSLAIELALAGMALAFALGLVT
jgi:predicted membrane channel-forming protein YqfA (hemolysin III family)